MAGSKEEVIQIVRSVGPPAGTDVADWVTKADQESSFRSDIVNGIGCVGYWQICPVNFSTVGFTQTQLKNGINNFKAAKIVYARQGWQAWAASGGKPTDAQKLEVMKERVDPRDATAGDVIASLNPIDRVSAVLDSTFDVVATTAKWIGDPHNWVRIVQVLGGIVVGTTAVALVLKETDAGKLAIKVAKKGL